MGSNETDALAVIGVLIESETSAKQWKKTSPKSPVQEARQILRVAYMTKVIDALPSIVNYKDEAKLDLTNCPIDVLPPDQTDSFYSYSGSLTTPAYQPIV